MNEEPRDPARIEVEIYGMSFRLRVQPEEQDRLKRAARHVDNVMRELVVSQTTPDTARMAIQAALLIAVDYYKFKEDAAFKAGVTDESRKRVDDLIQLLDESLRAL